MVTGADGEPELLLVCSFVGVIEYEVGSETSCNGKDDDCDGELDEDLIFRIPPDERWDHCIKSMGVPPEMIWMQPIDE